MDSKYRRSKKENTGLPDRKRISGWGPLTPHAAPGPLRSHRRTSILRPSGKRLNLKFHALDPQNVANIF